MNSSEEFRTLNLPHNNNAFSSQTERRKERYLREAKGWKRQIVKGKRQGLRVDIKIDDKSLRD